MELKENINKEMKIIIKRYQYLIIGHRSKHSTGLKNNTDVTVLNNHPGLSQFDPDI